MQTNSVLPSEIRQVRVADARPAGLVGPQSGNLTGRAGRGLIRRCEQSISTSTSHSGSMNCATPTKVQAGRMSPKNSPRARAASRQRSIVDQHHARSNPILEAPTRVLDRLARDREARLCLLVDVAGMNGPAVRAHRAGSGHGETRAGTDRARESNHALERRARGDELSGHEDLQSVADRRRRSRRLNSFVPCDMWRLWMARGLARSVERIEVRSSRLLALFTHNVYANCFTPA